MVMGRNENATIFRVNLKAVHIQSGAAYRSLGFEDENLGSSPGWWAATVAAYCRSRLRDYPNSHLQNLANDRLPHSVRRGHQLQSVFSTQSQGLEDDILESSIGRWADTAATHCPCRLMEHSVE